MNAYTKALHTYASKPYVVVERDSNEIIGISGNVAHARALGASKAGENGYRIVDLSGVDGFSESAASAGDLVGAYVAGLARGMTVADIADHYRASLVGSAVTARKHVAAEIRTVLGSLSRRAARRQVAEWILDGVG